MAREVSVEEFLLALVAKKTLESPGVMTWAVRSHGFSASWMFEVESGGTARRRDFDMSRRARVTKEIAVSVDDLAALAEAFRSSGFPDIEAPAGYQPRPDIGRTVASVGIVGGKTETASLPQDARSAPMQSIGAAFVKLFG